MLASAYHMPHFTEEESEKWRRNLCQGHAACVAKWDGALVADLRTQALTYYVYCLRQKRNVVAKESRLKREKRENENPGERHVVGRLGRH